MIDWDNVCRSEIEKRLTRLKAYRENHLRNYHTIRPFSKRKAYYERYVTGTFELERKYQWYLKQKARLSSEGGWDYYLKKYEPPMIASMFLHTFYPTAPDAVVKY